MDALTRLKSRLLEVYDLERATDVLRWDQTTYMPPGGAEARGRQVALLGGLAHERFVDPEIGRLLDAAERETASLPYESDETSLVRITRRSWEQSVRVPPALVAEFHSHTARSYQAWIQARPANDFARVQPMLEHTLQLSRQMADCFPGYQHIADPLIDLSDYGMKASSVKALFAALRPRLVPIMRAITSRPPADDSCLRQTAKEEDQIAFGLEVIRAFGYDFQRGRQDKTHHPFMTKFSLGDVRITTRINQGEISGGLFSTLHECGHALYEQGIDRSFEGTPLAHGASSGLHESQSRMWENLVGRSREFWEHYFPRLQEIVPSLAAVDLGTFYAAVNRVERSRIRVEADEVTYNLHVMLRFDLELDMLEGKLAVRDLPRVWRERFEADFGLQVPDDRDGCMQDVHWFAGPIGGVFQGYTLGNLFSAQLHAAAVEKHPSLPSEFRQGQFGTLLGWLREHVHRHGSKFTADELIRRVTGRELSIDPYLDYLWRKYQPLYGLREEERAPAGVS